MTLKIKSLLLTLAFSLILFSCGAEAESEISPSVRDYCDMVDQLKQEVRTGGVYSQKVTELESRIEAKYKNDTTTLSNSDKEELKDRLEQFAIVVVEGVMKDNREISADKEKKGRDATIAQVKAAVDNAQCLGDVVKAL